MLIFGKYTFDSMMLHINAIACLLIVGRLMFYQREERYSFVMSLVSYLVILASAWTAISIIWGVYDHADPADFFLHVMFCVAVFRAKGNLSKIAGDKS
ncbi:TPA: phage holin family protein [Yersinia enterocolitica]|nr:phage holin family protein [Yersinia enterocolitica]